MMLMRANSPANNALRLETMISKLERTRKTPTGWTARCPAHADRSPSLSVKESRGGTILVRCFAGCNVKAIVHAIGLEMRDLFPNARTARAPKPQPRPTSERVRAELCAELAKLELDGRRPLTRELNDVRHRVAVRLGISLKKLPEPLCDTYGNHARDPLWPAIFEHALFRAHIELTGAPPEQNSRRVDPNVLIHAEELAADMLRVEEHAASERLSHGRLAS